MANKNGKALVVPKTTTDVAIPDYIKAGAQGLENAAQEDVLIPRIKLLQKGSPEVDDLGMPDGHFTNSITKEDYGPSITFVPLFLYKTRIYFDEANNIVCSSDDYENPKSSVAECGPTCQKCKQKDWNEAGKTSKDKQPNCSIFYNFPCLLAGHEREPMALSFSSTKLRTAKEMITRARLLNRPLFAAKYTLTPVEAKDPAGHKYWALKLDGAGFVKEETFKMAMALSESFSKRGVAVDKTGAEKDI